MKPELVLLFVVVWNILVFIVYGVDKYKAKHGDYRISERLLLGLAFLMGAFGAVMGMYIFRHKTKHAKFQVLVPTALFLNVGVVCLVLYSGLM